MQQRTLRLSEDVSVYNSNWWIVNVFTNTTYETIEEYLNTLVDEQNEALLHSLECAIRLEMTTAESQQDAPWGVLALVASRKLDFDAGQNNSLSFEDAVATAFAADVSIKILAKTVRATHFIDSGSVDGIDYYDLWLKGVYKRRKKLKGLLRSDEDDDEPEARTYLIAGLCQRDIQTSTASLGGYAQLKYQQLHRRYENTEL
jgi:hypothetical protein